jgi:tetratricopeptide (TPR) repeat protein
MQPSGVIERESIPPAAVINRLTAPWYLDRLQADLHYRLGFLDALAGDWDAAQTHWRKIADLDPLLARAQQQRYYNTLRRLEGAAKNRHFVGAEEENARIPERVRPAILWADFCHMRERFDEAESLYRRLYRAADARNDSVVAARAALGIILRLYGDAGRVPRCSDQILARGREVGEAVLKKHARAPATAYVAFMIAHCIPMDGAAGREAASAACRRVAEMFPRSRHVEEARFWEVFIMLNADTMEQYLPEMERFRREFPNSLLIRNLEDRVEFIREWREHLNQLQTRGSP